MRLADRVKVFASSTGVGIITLGASVPTFQGFLAGGVRDGDSVRYVIEDPAAAAFEIGTGIYDADAGTLTRTPESSSDGGAAIDVSAGSTVAVVVAADDFILPWTGSQAEFEQLAADGGLRAGSSYVATDTAAFFIATGTRSYLEFESVGVLSPTNLLPNGNLRADDPPPTIVASGGGTALLAHDTLTGELIFTGGTGSAGIGAEWTGLGLVAGELYAVIYEAAGQAVGCVPRMFLGGQNLSPTGNLSGATGQHIVLSEAGGGDSLTVSFFTGGAGRALRLRNLRLFRALREVGPEYAAVDENSPNGTVIATLEGVSAGSTLSLAGGFNNIILDGLDLVVDISWTYAAAPSFNLTVTETLPGYYGSPKVSPIVVVTNDVPSLNDVMLANTAPGPFPVAIGGFNTSVFGRTPGSVLVLTNDGGGLFAYDDVSESLSNVAEIEEGDGSPIMIAFEETAAGVDNSPHVTNIGLTRS